jgi:uncharacterized delta-60 repeat protein
MHACVGLAPLFCVARMSARGALRAVILAVGVFVSLAAARADSFTIDPFFAPELRVSGGTIYAAAVQSDGKVIVGGDFTWVNGVQRFGIARLNTDGSVDATFDAQLAMGTVYALGIQSGGRLIVGGNFSSFGGYTRKNLAALTSTGAVDSSFTVGLNAPVRTLAVSSSGAVVVGGWFTGTDTGVSRSYVAKFNNDGTLATDFVSNILVVADSTGSAPIKSLLVLPDGRVLIGGQMYTVSGQATGGLALLATDGTLDPNWTWRAVPSTTAVARDSSGRLYGATNSGGTASWPAGRSIIRLTASLTPDLTWNPAYAGTITSLLPLDNGTVLVGGQSSDANAGPIVSYASDGTVDTSYRPGAVPNVVTALLNAGGTRLAVGSAADASTAAVATLDSTGVGQTAYQLKLQSIGYASSVTLQPDGKLLLAGRFDAIGNEAARNLVRLTTGGRVDHSFAPPAATSLVASMLVQSDGKILVRSAYSYAFGTTGPVVRLNADGSLDSSYSNSTFFYGGLNGWALLPNNEVLVQFSNTMFRYDTTGAQVATFSLDSSYVNLFTVQPDGHIVIGGSFTTAGPTQRTQPNIARYNADGTFDSAFTSPFKNTSAWQPISLLRSATDGKLLVGGWLTWADSTTASFGRLTAAGAQDTTFTSPLGANERIVDLVPRSDGSMLVAGNFDRARFRVLQNTGAYDSSLNVTVDGPSALGAALAGNAAGDIVAAGQFSIVGGVPRFGVVRFSPRTYFAQVPDSASVVTGGTLTITPQLGTNSGATYQWRRNGVAVSGATNSTLTIANFDPTTQNGSYTLVATVGTSSFETDAVTVAGEVAPTITSSPADVTDEVGSTVALRVAATGVPTPTYSWQKDGVTITGATNAVLTLPSLKTTDAGRYTVVVTNHAGSATSTAATVAVRTLRLDTTFKPTLVRDVSTALAQLLTLPDGRAVAGGTFQAVDGALTAAPAMLQANGALNTSFTPEYAGTPLALFTDGRVLVAGAQASTINGWSYPLRLLDSTGHLVAGFQLDLGSYYLSKATIAGSAVILSSTNSFTVGGMTATNGLARIRLDGTVDTNFSAAAGTGGVWPTVLGAMADGRIYVAYQEYSNGYTDRIVRLTTSGTVDSTFVASPLTDGSWTVTSVVQSDGRLVVGVGSSTDTGPRGLVRFNLDGTRDTAFTAALPALASGDTVLAPLGLYSDGRLLVKHGSHWWRLASSGARDMTFDVAGVDSLTVSAVLTDNTIVAAELQNSYNAKRATPIHRFDNTGAALSTGCAHFGIIAATSAVAYAPGGSIYVAGDFDWANATAQHSVARLTPTGATDTTFVSPLSTAESVTALTVQSDGCPIVAGTLQATAGGQSSQMVIRLQADGTRDPHFAVVFDQPSTSDRSVAGVVLAGDDSVYVYGSFTQAARTASPGLVHLIADGGLDLGFIPTYQSGPVTAVAPLSGGGVLAAVAGGSVLRKMDVTGAVDATWHEAKFSDRILTLLPRSDGSTTVVGKFGTADAVAVTGVAHVLASGTVDSTYPASLPTYWDATGYQAAAIDPATGKVVLGGTFSSLNGVGRLALGRIEADGTIDRSFLPRLTGRYVSVATVARRADGDLLAGGAFTAVDGMAHTGLARWTFHSFTVTFANAVTEVASGGSATLGLTVQGTGPFTYQWQHNGVDVAGATDATLALTGATAAMAGQYTLRVSNGTETQVSDSMVVTVQQAPTITRQPQSVSAEVGGVVEFTAAATAVPAATYQWYKDGMAIAGADEAELLINPARIVDAGTYTVTVTNALGAVTSAPATLTITGAQLDEGFVPSLLNFGQSLDRFNRIYAVQKLADGRWLIGGNFPGINGHASRYLARLLPNGDVDSTYDAPAALTQPVQVFTVLSTGKIMVGTRSSDSYYSTPSSLALRLLADGTPDTSFAPLSGTGRVNAFAEDANGALYIGGDFTADLYQCLVRVTASGDIDAQFTSALASNAAVRSAAVWGNGVVVGLAARTYYGDSGLVPLQRLTSSGARDTSWNPTLGNGSAWNTPTVTDVLATSAGKLMVVGSFSTVNGSSRAGVAQFNSDGTLDTTFVPAAGVTLSKSPQVTELTSGGCVVFGAQLFSGTYGGASAVQYNSDGTVAHTYELGTSDTCEILAVFPSGEAVGRGNINSGNYWYYGYSDRLPALLEFNSSGVVSGGLSFEVDATASVTCVAALPDGRLIVGGEFTEVDGASRLKVVRLLPGGGVDPTFAPTVLGASYYGSSGLSTIVVQSDGRIIIGGSFSLFNGIVRNNLVRLNADGSVDGAYNPAPNGTVTSLALDTSGRLLVAGSYSTIGGGAASSLARLGVDGALDPTFTLAVPANSVASVVTMPSGKILCSVAANTKAGIKRLNPDGSLDLAFEASSANAGEIALLPDGRVAAVMNGYGNLRVYTTSGTSDSTFHAVFGMPSYYSSYVRHVFAQSNGRIVVTGSFSAVNGAARTGVVRLRADGSVDTSFFPGSGPWAVDTIAAIAQQPDGSLVFGGSFSRFDGRNYSNLVRYVDRTFFVRVRQPSVLVSSGAAATLAVDVTGLGTFSYVWKHDGAVVSGATTATLALSNASSSTAGKYVCEVTSGSTTVASNPINVTIGGAPVFTTQPAAVKTDFANPVTLSCVVTGDAPLTYQWYRYGTAITGATTDTLNLPASSGSATGLYQVVATNGFGQTSSNLVSVVTGTAPTIVTQPSGRSAQVGDYFSISIGVSGSPSPFVQWQKNGVVIPGATGTYVSFSSATTNDSGSYAAVVSNAFGSVTSDACTVAVTVSSGQTPVTPTIQQQPTSQTLTAGYSYVTLSVVASGTPAPTYQWRKDGTAITGSTYSTLSLGWVTLASAGNYDVVVTNSAGSVTSSVAVITVQQAPTFAAYPQNANVLVGSTVTLASSVLAQPAATFQWKKDGNVISGATDSTLVLRNVQMGDAGSYTIVATSTLGSASSSANVYVTDVLQNGLVAATAKAPGEPNITGTFTIEGTNTKRMLLRAIGPSLTAFGTTGAMQDPLLTLTDSSGAYVAHNNDWGDAANPGDIIRAGLQLGVFALGTSSKDSALLVNFAPGTYTATISPADGATGVALLDIYQADYVQRLAAFSFRAQAGSGPSTLTCGFVVSGLVARPYLIRALGPVLGTSTALTDPRLAVYSNAMQVVANDDWSTDTAEAARLTSAAARLGGVALASGSKDAALLITLSPGTYVAQVSGPDASAGDSVLEIIEADSLRSTSIKPWFVVQPDSQDAPAGSSVKLVALAGGAPAPTYQWMKDGVVVAGATNATLTLPNFQSAQVGTYAVVATNSAGTATSIPSVATIGTGIQLTATHSVVGGGYAAGTVLEIKNTVSFSSTATSLAWSATLPAGWTYAAGGTNEGDVKPADGATGTVSWAWTTVPASPVTFTYRVNVPADENVIRSIVASATLRTSTSSVRTIPANPNPLSLVPKSMLHTADTDLDFKVSVLELSRVVELYNTRNGSTRTGCYSVQGGTEDGFAADATRSSTATVTLTTYHSADENKDGKISVLELSRVIELYNYRAAGIRTGQYHVQLGTEDGFGAGP